MWIEEPEANRSTRRISQKVLDDDGKVVEVHVAEFNHNGRAEVTKRTGEFFLKEYKTLKAVKDGGPPPSKETDEAEVEQTDEATTEEVTDA